MQALLPRPVSETTASARQHWLGVGIALVIGLAMARYYQWLLLDLKVATDVQDHIDYLARVCGEGYAWPANPGFHWLAWLVSGLKCDRGQLLHAATYALGISWGASVYLAIWVGNILPRAAVNQGVAGANGWSATAVVLAAVAACFLYTFQASWLIGGFNNYLGLLPPNVYHNSTLIVAMPFSIAAFGLGLRQWRAGSRASFWFDALLGEVLVGCALCKPSYAFAFVPAYGVLRLLQFRREPVVRLLVGLTLALLPVLLVIVGQAQWIARHPEVSFHGESHVALAFPAGWKMLLFLTDVDDWDSFLLGVSSFALPLLAYALRPAWLRQPAHQLAVLSTVFAFAQFMLVYESGSRAGHGNFMWQVMAANHLLYWVVVLEVLRSPRPVTKAGWARQAVLVSAVVLSVLSGLNYMYAIATTGTYN